MKFRRNKSKSKIFKKFLLSYFVILLIPLILATFAYNAATSVVEENAINSRLTMLTQTRDIVDKHLKELDEMIIQIAFDPKLNSLLYIKEPESGSSDIYKLWDYSREIKSRTVTTNVFKSTFFIFFKNSNFVFSHDDTFYNFNKFYNTVLTYDDLSYEQWYDSLFKDYKFRSFIPAHEVTINNGKMSAITYLCSLPMVTESKPQGAIAFLIDEQEIAKMLSNQIFEDSGSVVLKDSKGTVIMHLSNDRYNANISNYNFDDTEGYLHKNINGVDTILIHTKSDYSGLSYTAALPKSVVTKKVQYIKEIALGVAGISLILGLLISYFWAYSNTKPFKEVLLTLRDFTNNDSKIKMDNNLNEYDYLKGSISNLISGNKDMQESLSRQSAELKTVLIDRLLKGDFIDKSKMTAILEHSGINIYNRKFVVLVFKINYKNTFINSTILDELEVLRVKFEEIIISNIGNNGYLHFINENEIAVLLNIPDEDTKSVIDKVNIYYDNIKQQMYNSFHLSLNCGIGELYDSLYDVHFSYWEAVHALESIYENTTYEHAVWYHDLDKDNTTYYYPMDLEIKLTNLAKAGNWADIENIIDKIYSENYKKRRISKSLEKYLLYNMKATIIKLLGEVKSDADMRNLDHFSDSNAESVFDNIRNLYYKICMSVEETRKSHNNLLINNIIEYIEKNYTDPNLSISSIVSEFNLNESYFSQFFKEQTGEYFSNYVENLRIKLACELIKGGSLSIDAISLKTGYNSSNSFRRAFKRVTGIAPSQYSSSPM